jgi:hypothetical protein
VGETTGFDRPRRGRALSRRRVDEKVARLGGFVAAEHLDAGLIGDPAAEEVPVRGLHGGLEQRDFERRYMRHLERPAPKT